MERERCIDPEILAVSMELDRLLNQYYLLQPLWLEVRKVKFEVWNFLVYTQDIGNTMRYNHRQKIISCSNLKFIRVDGVDPFRIDLRPMGNCSWASARSRTRHHTLTASPQERNRHGNLVKARVNHQSIIHSILIYP